MQLMSNHFTDNVPQMPKKCQQSVLHLKSIFKSAVGISPYPLNLNCIIMHLDNSVVLLHLVDIIQLDHNIIHLMTKGS